MGTMGVDETDNDAISSRSDVSTPIKKKRTHTDANRPATKASILGNVKKSIKRYHEVESKKKMRLQMMAIYTDSRGRIHTMGSKVLRTIFKELKLKPKMLSSARWKESEVINSNSLNESLFSALPKPTEPLEKSGADRLEKFLQGVLSTIYHGKRVIYEGRPKPDFWPPDVDFTSSKSRTNFKTTCAIKYPTKAAILRRILRYIYAFHNCYELLDDGQEPLVNRNETVTSPCSSGHQSPRSYSVRRQEESAAPLAEQDSPSIVTELTVRRDATFETAERSNTESNGKEPSVVPQWQVNTPGNNDKAQDESHRPAKRRRTNTDANSCESRTHCATSIVHPGQSLDAGVLEDDLHREANFGWPLPVGGAIGPHIQDHSYATSTPLINTVHRIIPSVVDVSPIFSGNRIEPFPTKPTVEKPVSPSIVYAQSELRIVSEPARETHEQPEPRREEWIEINKENLTFTAKRPHMTASCSSPLQISSLLNASRSSSLERDPPRNDDQPDPGNSGNTHSGHYEDGDDPKWICQMCMLLCLDEGEPSIGCDKCDYWYHLKCVDISKAPSERQRWWCPRCSLADTLRKYVHKSKQHRYGICGLVGGGNFCYLNSVVQAVLACPILFNLFHHIGSKLKVFPSSVPLLESLSRLTSDIANKKSRTPLNPDYFRKAVSKLRVSAFTGAQEDAEEFLSCLLNRIHDELLAVSGDATGQSVMSDICFGQQQYVTATNYGEHASNEAFIVLHLPVLNDGVTNLNAAFRSLTSIEPITPGYPEPMTRKMMLCKLPRVLILHLKYFKYVNGRLQKKVKDFQYPLEWTIGSEFFSDSESCLPDQRRYSLYGVVFHHGRSASSGHYTAMIKHAGQWFQMDDATTTPVSQDQALLFRPPRVPYLLFYCSG